MIVNNRAFFNDVIDILKTQDVIIKIKGTSMWPFFKDGQTDVTLTKSDTYKKNDICLFTYQDTFIIHRLIKIKDNKYIFKGDGLTTKEVVNKKSIIAKVSHYQTKKLIDVTKKSYRCRVFLYRLLPRRLILKVFK